MLGVLMRGVLGGLSRRLGKTPTRSASRRLGKRKKNCPNDRNSSDEAIHATLDGGLLGVSIETPKEAAKFIAFF
jgi:hypothetical protein